MDAHAGGAAVEPLLVTCRACGANNRVRPERVADQPRCGRCGRVLVLASQPVAVTDASFAREVEAAALPVLVDFWAPWCGPCRMIGPVVEKLAAERAGRLKVAKVNVDENPGLAARFGVSAIPTLAIFRGGALVDEIRGAVPRAVIEEHLARAGA
jgi:thioredoxin 2